MPPTPSDLRRLLSLLSALTVQEKIRWEPTPDENEFMAVLGNGIVRLGRRRPYVSSPPQPGEVPDNYVITVLDQKNRIIAEYSVTEGEDKPQVAELWGTARRLALDLDQSYKNLLDEMHRRLG